MKRQRAIPASLPTGISVTSARPVLRSSTRFNRVVPAAPAAMSYKDLVKVVGVDPESNPSYWRKAIDHSAETVVFFQVDLRGTLPRMCKSVRISQAEENQQLLLVPSVYIGDTLLSGSYVKTIIGKRFLADEDDLMKLLEHAGILQENEELTEEKEENRATAEGDEDTGENYMFVAEPVAKKLKQREKRDLTANAQWDSESDSALPGVPGDWPGRSKTPPKKLRQQEKRKTQASATTAPRITRARSAHTTAENDATGSAPVHGRRQPIDLNALFVPDAVDAEASSRHANASLSQEDTPMESDYDTGGLPVADEDNDEFALGFDPELPGPSTADDTGDGAVDSPEVNEPVDGSGNCGSGSASGTSVKPRKPAPHHISTSEPSDGTARLSKRTDAQKKILHNLRQVWNGRTPGTVTLFPGARTYLPKAIWDNFKVQLHPNRPGIDAVNLAELLFGTTENMLALFTGDRFGLKHALGREQLQDVLSYINGYHPAVVSKKARGLTEIQLLQSFSRKLYYYRSRPKYQDQ